MSTAKYIVAADLGGTNGRSGVFEVDTSHSRLLEDTYVSAKTDEMEQFDEVLDATVSETIGEFCGKYHGVVVDVPGPVADHRILLKAPNMRSLHRKTPYDVGGKLNERFAVPSIAVNDLEAGLAGEVSVGALKGKKWAMLENLGTGYGGARLFNGVAVAAEPGHVWLPGADTVRCGCGKTDCAEARLSGGAIEMRVREECERRSITIPTGMHPCAFADSEANRGTEWAVELYTDVASALGNLWGSKLNDCPVMTDIVYQGSFLERAMQIEFFRQQVRGAMLKRSMLPEQHAAVVVQPVQAPRRQNGDSLGPLYGCAYIWNQQHGTE